MYPLGALVAEGKTKKLYEVRNNPGLVIVVSKDDITAGDGAKRNVIPDKGQFATTTTCNVFRLLKNFDFPVAFVEQDSPTSFVAPKCTMLPVEVVVRREAHGSYLKRNPETSRGTVFANLLVELFLKTTGAVWGEHQLPVDDPLVVCDHAADLASLYHPAQPMGKQRPFLKIPTSEVLIQPDHQELQAGMEVIAAEAFSIIERAWRAVGGRLLDYKVEFGIDPAGQLRLADVIDNDSWRVIMEKEHVDKQTYRDGAALDEVAAKYRLVADLTSRFTP